MTKTATVKREAQERLAKIAEDLAGLLDPLDAASLMMGPAITLLARQLGPAGAVSYLRDLADQIEAGAASPPTRQ